MCHAVDRTPAQQSAQLAATVQQRLLLSFHASMATGPEQAGRLFASNATLALTVMALVSIRSVLAQQDMYAQRDLP